MSFKKYFKTFLYKTDFFYTSELLRYKDQPQYRTLCGGFLSLFIIVSLITTFYSKFMDTIEKVQINSISNNINDVDPTPFTISTFTQDKFMFGVEIWHHDLNTGPRYFDVILLSAQFDTGQKRPTSIQHPLEPCQASHWQGFPDVQKQYARLKMNYWLCLPKNSTYNIQGKYSSVFSQTLQVAVKKCTNASNPSRPCADQATIDQYFIDKGPFFFTIYFMNPLINPTSQDYLTHYLQDNNYIIFTQKSGAQGVLFMQQYDIETDQSILPFIFTHRNRGGRVDQYALKNPYQLGVNGNVYCSFSIFKSGITRNYSRSFQKLDQILSYIGGLFGTISILLFLVNIYNTHSFQIALGAYLFQNQNKKQLNNLKNYNFFTFLQHLFFIALNAIGCYPNWQKIKKYNICREQMKKQLDVRYLIKRIIFLERTIKLLFQDYQLKGLHFLSNLTLQQAKRGRKNFKIKKNVLKECKQIRNQQLINALISMQNQRQNTSTVLHSYKSPIFQNPKELSQNSPNQKVFSNQLKLSDFALDVNLQKLELFLDQDSSSSQQDNSDDQVSDQIIKLKQQSKQKDGNPLSKKIWENIDQQIKKQLQFYEMKQEKRKTLRLEKYQSLPALKNANKKMSKFANPTRQSKLSHPKIANSNQLNEVYDKDRQKMDRIQQYDRKLFQQRPSNILKTFQQYSSPNNLQSQN